MAQNKYKINAVTNSNGALKSQEKSLTENDRTSKYKLGLEQSNSIDSLLDKNFSLEKNGIPSVSGKDCEEKESNFLCEDQRSLNLRPNFIKLFNNETEKYLLDDQISSHEKEKAIEQIPVCKKTSSPYLSIIRSIETDIRENDNIVQESSLINYNDPYDALGKSNQRSMDEINHSLIGKDKYDGLKFKESSQSLVEDFSCKDKILVPSRETALSSIHKIENTEKESERSRKCHSVIGLSKEQFNLNAKPPLPPSSYELNRNKSRSLGNLSFLKNNYDHVQSKVKKYISERKLEQAKLTSAINPKSKSLPVTPLKLKREISNDVLLLDEKTLDSLSISNNDQKQDLPEDLKKLKQEMHNENTRSSILETLFDKLKKERECRVDQDITLNALQLDYDNLLTKYAQAKNLIDSLRFYKDVYNRKEDSASTSSSVRPKSSNFKKAYSTSNIFAESLYSINYPETTKSSNLVKCSSSPVVNPKMNLSFLINREKDSFIDLKSSLEDLNERDSNISTHSSLENSFDDWLDKYKYVYQKVQEFILLENSSALKPEERNLVLNYIFEKYSELSFAYQSFNECAPREYGFKRKLEEIKQAVEILSNKFGFNKSKQKFTCKDTFEISSSGLSSNLPPGNAYPFIRESPNFDPSSDLRATQSSKSRGNKREGPSRKYPPYRDIDSGCPPSDRSARNSQLQSFEHDDLLSQDVESTGISAAPLTHSRRAAYVYTSVGKTYEPEPYKNLLNLSSINVGIEETTGTGVSPSSRGGLKKMSEQSITTEEDYDASGSSGLDDLCQESRSKKAMKKRHIKSHKPYQSKILDKYEDKFICRHKSDISQSSGPSSQSSSKNCVYVLSKMEKNAKYFEVQVNDLKSKRLPKNKPDGMHSNTSLPSRQSTPLKALSKESLNYVSTSSDLNLTSSGPKLSENEDPKYKDVPPHIPKFASNADKVRRTESWNEPRLITEKSCPEVKVCSTPVNSNRASRRTEFSTSTPKSSDHHRWLDNTCNVVKCETSPCLGENRAREKRSCSVPCLQTCQAFSSAPFIYIEHFNCSEKTSTEFVPCSVLSNRRKTDHLPFIYKKGARRRSENYEDRGPSLLVSLNEATSLAETLRLRSQNVLTFLHTNLEPLYRS